MANFEVGDAALMEVLTGEAVPVGRMPFALAADLETVARNAPDLSGYPGGVTLYPFGHGLRYGE